MSKEFGPQSTNPRHRRAYAHALRAKAVTPDEKVHALEAANAASNTTKGKGLGEQTLRAFINQYENRELSRFVYPPDRVWDGSMISWSSPEFVRRHEAVAQVVGRTAGVVITKPSSPEEYYAAAVAVDAEEPTAENADFAHREDLSLLTADYSIPGTAFQWGAAQALAWSLTR